MQYSILRLYHFSNSPTEGAYPLLVQVNTALVTALIADSGGCKLPKMVGSPNRIDGTQILIVDH